MMSRTNLLLTGGSASKKNIRTQFWVLIGFSVVMFIIPISSNLKLLSALLGTVGFYILGGILQLISLVITILARRAIRKRDNIPTGCCGAVEDCCAGYWCGCCVTSQLMRQTADYGEVEGVCFSQTGLPDADDSV